MRSQTALGPLAALALAAVAHAATVHVPGDQATIAAALDAVSMGDTVLVACGTYAEADLAMKQGVCLKGEGAGCTTIDAGGAGRCLVAENLDDATRIEDLTFTGGAHDEIGGGLYLSYADLVLSRCILAGNAAKAGGGAACEYSFPRFIDCEFTGNAALSDAPSGDYGGGLYALASGPVLSGCRFAQNQAGNYGGAVYISGGNGIELTDCLFEDNDAVHYGGAVICLGSSPRLESCRFEGNAVQTNDASRGLGGALSVWNGSNVYATDCEFVANTARNGGAFNAFGSSPEFGDCRFADNSAVDKGAGLYLNSSSATLAGCVLEGNVAAGRDAAIHCLSASTCDLAECTLAYNTGGAGAGGIGLGGTDAETACAATLTRVIIAFSVTGQAVFCDAAENTVSLSCCDIFGNAGGDYSGCLEGLDVINGNFSADPQFCGGASGNLFLQSDSPCAVGNPHCGMQVGALGILCGNTATSRASWGAVKRLY